MKTELVAELYSMSRILERENPSASRAMLEAAKEIERLSILVERANDSERRFIRD